MTHLESIKSNAFLLGLNMNKATKEQKIQWLCQIIDNETDKPEDEIDFALIGECSAYLRELSDKAAEATKEQKQRILQQIKARHNQTATKSAKVLRPRWKTARKVVGIAIAAVLLLTLTLSVIAKVNGYSSAWEYVKENIQRITGMDAGDRVNEDGITLVKNDRVITYNSVEALIQAEGYDILYPTDLPDSVEISNIIHQIVSEEKTIYCYQFTDPTLFIAASTTRDFLPENLKHHKILENVSLEAYLVKEADGDYQAVVYDGKYEYSIRCQDYDVLLKIINGMKGIEK